MTRTIVFDREKRDQLRKAYDFAVEQKKLQFVFDGNVFVTSYAKYMLEYLDGQFAMGEKEDHTQH